MCERWAPRAHRIEERLARDLELAVAASKPNPTPLTPDHVLGLEEETRSDEHAIGQYEKQAHALRAEFGGHPDLIAAERDLATARRTLHSLRTALAEAKR